MRSLSVAATGMMAQQLNVEVISNNIANMTTTGFKRRRPEFQDRLYQSQRRIGATTSSQGTIVPAGVQLGLGVKAAAVYRVHEQGDLTNTGNPLDLAIQGQGYFVVETPDGETVYTRSGNFQLSLEALGSNFLRETDASGAATVGAPGTQGTGAVQQGYLESSNVNPVQEITALIAAQRAYDLNSKVITASDEMMSTI